MRIDYLKEYVSKLQKENLTEYLIKNQLDYLAEGNNLYRIVSTIQQKMQLKFNQSIWLEMKNLQAFCVQNNIKNVFVKGLVLANQLYAVPEERIYGDIDMFVEPDKLEFMSQYLFKNGYRDESDALFTNQQTVFQYYNPIHFSAFIKGEIGLEIHIIPFYTNTISNDLLSQEAIALFYENREFVCIEGEMFPTLERSLNALFLLDHFVKHITFFVKTSFRDGNFKVHVQLNKLIEAAKFIEKFHISQEALYSLAKKYHSVPTLMLALKYLNEILKMDFPLSENIYSYIAQFPVFENKLIGELYQLTLKDVLENENNPAFYEKLITNFSLTPSFRLKIPKKTPGVCGAQFSLDTANPNNLYGTHFHQRTHDQNKMDFKVSGVLNWDENGLNANWLIMDKTVPAKDGNLVEFCFCKKETMLYHSESVYIRMLLNPKGDPYVYYDYIHREKVEKEMHLRNFCNVQFTGIPKEGYAVSFSVPWNILGITPQVGETLLFDISVLSQNRETCWDVLSLGTIDKDSDPYSYSILELDAGVDFLYEE